MFEINSCGINFESEGEKSGGKESIVRRELVRRKISPKSEGN